MLNSGTSIINRKRVASMQAINKSHEKKFVILK
jgi:hypothetical protein